MTPYEYYNYRMKYITEDLHSAQKVCLHPSHYVEKTARSYTDYAGDTEYWYNCKCEYCGKIWAEDQ